MKYSVRQRANPMDRGAQAKFYAAPVWNEEIDIRQLAEEIAASCTLTPADIVAVLESFIAVIPPHLIKGDVVRLGDFGILKLTFGSDGRLNEADVSADLIKNTRVLFLSRPELKSRLKRASFRKKA